MSKKQTNCVTSSMDKPHRYDKIDDLKNLKCNCN